MDTLREVMDQMSAYDRGVRDGKLSAAETIATLLLRVADLTEAAQDAHKHLPYGGTRDWLGEVLGIRVADDDEGD